MLKVLNDFESAFFSYVHRGLIERKAAGAAAANTYWKLDIVSVVLGSYERRIFNHICTCNLAHSEFQSRRQLATVARSPRVGHGVTECICYRHS